MNTLKRIIIIRHCQCDHHGFLTAEGGLTAKKLASAIVAGALLDSIVAVLCSQEARAIRTAQRLCVDASIDGRPQIFNELFSSDRAINLSGAVRVIREYAEKHHVETLIVVTHLEMVQQLPCAIAYGMFDTARPFPKPHVYYGQGVVINCETHTTSIIR
jgi:phosphohistidine phosphatase SixA